ncbi:uncharacterized protein LOC135499071 [Lineus longissimus]|uniref:uncharacterized protein LOC135499071 n=1 Tax=Lineus longissimus TaxID=88925 RepID=UPI002B4EABFE
MADELEKFRSMPVFWTSDDDKSGNFAIIPGITRMAGVGNLRPKVKGHRTKEVKAGIPRHQPLVDELMLKETLRDDEENETNSEKENSGSSQLTYTKESKSYHPRPKQRLMKDLGNQPRPKNHSRKASLSDLCVEDKKRVANLITELAKLGEEKESAVETLRGERNQFEEKIGSLVQQKESILKERTEIEAQLEECQQLLIKYQDRIQKHQELLMVREEVAPPNRASTPLKTPQLPKPVSPHLQDGGVTSPRSVRNASMYTPKQTNVPDIAPLRDQVPMVPPSGHYMMYPPFVPLSHAYPYPVQPDPQYPGPYQRRYTNKIDAMIAQERCEGPTDQFIDAGVSRPERNNYRPETDEYWLKPDLYYEATGKAPPRGYHGDDWESEKHRPPGPLHNPLLSSTQRSGVDVSHARNGGNFAPLVPEFGESYASIPVVRSHARSDQRDFAVQNGHGDFDRRKHRDVLNGYDAYNGHRHVEVEEENHRRQEYNQNGFRDNGYEGNYDVNGNCHGQFETNKDAPIRGQQLSHREREWEMHHRHHEQDHREVEYDSSPISTNFHDHINGDSFGTYYKKLTPEERRKQMVAQKEALLREQHRLRKILHEHEGMLREKQLQLHRQQEKQRRRMKTFEKTGEFPLPTDTEESGPDAVEEKAQKGRIPIPVDLPPSPVHKSFIEAGTSPLRFSDEAPLPASPLFMDVATEMTQPDQVAPSLRSPPPNAYIDDGCRRLSSPGLDFDAGRQGNLPLVYNRQRTTPRSTSLTPPLSERALSVVEIVDSLEHSEPLFSPRHVLDRGSHRSESDEEVEEEESKLLEDVFFLK